MNTMALDPLLNGPRWALHVGAYILLTFLILSVCPWLGSEELSPSAVWQGGQANMDADIFYQHRLPRLLLGFVVGGTLAAVGCVFQVLFRNPLATPYTLGVTGGGTLGAYAALSFSCLHFGMGPFSSVQVFALLGSLAVLLLIAVVARRVQGVSMTTLLLAGVTLGIMCNAFILLFRYIAEPHILVSMDRWTMGRLDVVGIRSLAPLWPLVLPGLGLLTLQIRVLNALSLGQDLALGHGVDVVRVQRHCLLGGALATAAVVSLAGPIGFVGLIVPHVVRRLSGTDHRLVLPASFLTGGAFLVLCDTVARTVLAPTEIPVGVITALVGGPFFITLLLRRW
jgi:iron complex transport system permease protein